MLTLIAAIQIEDPGRGIDKIEDLAPFRSIAARIEELGGDPRRIGEPTRR